MLLRRCCSCCCFVKSWDCVILCASVSSSQWLWIFKSASEQQPRAHKREGWGGKEKGLKFGTMGGQLKRRRVRGEKSKRELFWRTWAVFWTRQQASAEKWWIFTKEGTANNDVVVVHHFSSCLSVLFCVDHNVRFEWQETEKICLNWILI